MKPLINMGWGHPAYMRDYWRGAAVGTFIGFDSGIDYQLDPGNPNLIEAIRELHDSEGNAVTEGKHIVIGNGATQIIRAIMSMYDTCYAQVPFYSRFPVTAKKEGLTFHALTEPEDGFTSGMEIVTSPNNPTGNRTKNYTHCPLVYDLCYNWYQYSTPVKEDHDVMIFSLSKATGHAGSRVGWGIFSDKDVADKVQEFVELDTCGVSADSQTKALSMILDQLKRPKNKRCFYFGRYELKYRWAKFKQVMAHYDNITVKNRLGMFALVKVEDPSSTGWVDAEEYFKENFGVFGVSGDNFGMDRTYLRLNIGCETSDFDDFIKRMEGRDD